MIKAVLFDLDGIVVTKRDKYFSVRYAEEHGVPLESVSEFFLGRFKKCSMGECDLKEEIAPYLPKWKWEGGVDEYLEYWFRTESGTDDTVLALIERLRASGYPCYIATRQEKYRMQYLLGEMGLKDRFDGTFVTHEIGYEKSDERFWKHVEEKLGLAPEEILFFDDTQKNIDVAKSLGIDAHFYDGIHVLEAEVRELGAIA